MAPNPMIRQRFGYNLNAVGAPELGTVAWA